MDMEISVDYFKLFQRKHSKILGGEVSIVFTKPQDSLNNRHWLKRKEGKKKKKETAYVK